MEKAQQQLAALDALYVPCQRCGAAAGIKCHNYKGQNKQTCPQRGKIIPAGEMKRYGNCDQAGAGRDQADSRSLFD